MSNRLLGQNFLKNPAVIKKIIAALDIKSGDTILEVGPGHGELTNELLLVSNGLRDSDGGNIKIIAIEKDAMLAAELRGRLGDEIEIISGDILEELPVFADGPSFPRHHFKIVGNIPYYLTGHLFRIIGELPHPPELCVLMIQKEVAERLVAASPRMNKLAASVQYWADPKIISSVPRRNFFPAPNVDSTIILLKKKAEPIFKDSEYYFAAVRALFSQPRKTILNNLAATSDFIALDPNVPTGELKEKISERLTIIGIDPKNRPQDLSPEQIAKIAHFFQLKS